jgi:hypothetical protein
MGTNYFLLIKNDMNMNQLVENICESIAEFGDEVGFDSLEKIKFEIDKFLDQNRIHIGKKSFGWNFVVNLNQRKYYHDRSSLFKFIESGQIVSEDGQLVSKQQFIFLLQKCEENADQHDATNIDGISFLDCDFR